MLRLMDLTSYKHVFLVHFFLYLYILIFLIYIFVSLSRVRLAYFSIDDTKITSKKYVFN